MKGVRDAYAIQAGREIRVIAQPDQLDDAKAAGLARNIRRRIEDELQYPGTIRVTVVREQRFQETAK
jgi:ribonuclease Y